MSDLRNELLTAEVTELIHNSADGSSITQLDGDPFIIVDGWGDLSKINDILNSVHCPKEWAEWKPLFLARHEMKQQETEAKGYYVNRHNPDIYGDMRWKDEPEGVPDWSRNTLYTPDGLISLDEVCEWGFSDEYSTCSECYNAVRISPDSYGWQMEGYYSDDSLYCAECVDADEYTEFMMNRPALLNEELIDLAAEGWTDLELQMENGFHRGQNDDPNLVLKIRESLFPFVDVVFTGTVGQFDVAFTAWIKPGINTADDLGEWVNKPELLSKIIGRLLERGYIRPRRGPADEAMDALKTGPIQYAVAA